MCSLALIRMHRVFLGVPDRIHFSELEYPSYVLLWDKVIPPEAQPLRVICQKRGSVEFLAKLFGSEGMISLSHNTTS